MNRQELIDLAELAIRSERLAKGIWDGAEHDGDYAEVAVDAILAALKQEPAG